MNKLITIDTIALDTVTGGQADAQFVSPCLLNDNMTLGQLKKLPDHGKDTLALEMAQCGLPIPSKKLINEKKHIFFEAPPINAR